MTTDRKKPGVAFWATLVLIAGLVAYPLSAGPASWACEHGLASEATIDLVYSPIIWLIDGPRRPLYGTWIGTLFERYVDLWR